MFLENKNELAFRETLFLLEAKWANKEIQVFLVWKFCLWPLLTSVLRYKIWFVPIASEKVVFGPLSHQNLWCLKTLFCCCWMTFHHSKYFQQILFQGLLDNITEYLNNAITFCVWSTLLMSVEMALFVTFWYSTVLILVLVVKTWIN